MLARARETIERMLGAEGYDRFFDETVGHKPLFVADDPHKQRLKLFPEDARQTILAAYDSHSAELTHHAARPTGPAPDARRAGDPAEFAALIAEYHGNGLTVRIPDAAALFPALARFVRALETVLLVKVEAEFFWSSEGLSAPVHYDNSDIIAIQLFGEKRWFVSTEPSSLPNPWKLAGERASKLGPARQFEMKAGDLLYIPRGTLHTVDSTRESLHASIGFTPITLRDAIAATVDRLADLDRPLRVGITPRADDLAHGSEIGLSATRVREGVAELAQACRSDAFIAEALDHRAARLVAGLPRLEPVAGAERLTADSTVEHTDLAVAKLISTSDIIDFAQPGGRILIHPGAEPGLRFVAENPQFRIADIPGEIGDDVRLALVGRLMQSGFLRPASA